MHLCINLFIYPFIHSNIDQGYGEPQWIVTVHKQGQIELKPFKDKNKFTYAFTHSFIHSLNH